jgi:tripartite-type tricarboxylate transporter receptor subunit TctC
MMNNKTKRWLYLPIAILAGIVLFLPLPAAAQHCGDRFADQTISWIVPSSPGGGYDMYSRLIAPYYEKYTGGQVVVQNRSGAGGRIGAAQIMNAAPDGLTLGILNGPGLIMASAFETSPVPNPATDFTILGRVASNRHIWATGIDSALPPLRTLLEDGQSRSVVFGTRGPGTLSFVDIVLASHILNLNVDIITGFQGSRDGILGVLRGDIDAVAHSHSSLVSSVDAGELRPWLQVSDGPITDDSAFVDVPVLAGPDGLAAYSATLQGRDVQQAVAQAQALVELTSAGRLIAAPPGLDTDLSKCIQDALHAALTDEEFVANAAAANLFLDVARGEEAAARLRAIQPDVMAFRAVLRDASEKYGK